MERADSVLEGGETGRKLSCCEAGGPNFIGNVATETSLESGDVTREQVLELEESSESLEGSVEAMGRQPVKVKVAMSEVGGRGFECQDFCDGL